MTRRRTVHASLLDLEAVHALQLELTDRSQQFEQLQLAPPPPSTCMQPAIAGDVITLDGTIAVVRAHCDADPRGYYCLPCRQRLANAYQLELHTAHGTHCVARECMLHGLETL